MLPSALRIFKSSIYNVLIMKRECFAFLRVIVHDPSIPSEVNERKMGTSRLG